MARTMLRAAHFFSSVACAVGVALANPAVAADSDIIEIEEHWELRVGGPDAAHSAPQVTMIMSPTDGLSGDFFAFTLNHWTFPDFAGGGHQLQRWHGGECITAANGANKSHLYNDGEVIVWVQRLTLHEGQLKFQVLNGASESWGNFGSEGYNLEVPTSLTRLNGYRPGISIDQSGIGYAGNRVSSLTLQKLRWKTADGQEHEMVAPIDIDSDLDP